MFSSRSQRVKCVTSPSAVTAPVTSLVTTRKRSSLWWRPTTTSSVEPGPGPPPSTHPNQPLIDDKPSGERDVVCGPSTAACSSCCPVAESPPQLFSAVCARAPDRRAAAASMWLASLQTMTRNCHVSHRLQTGKQDTRQHNLTNIPSSALP